MKKWIWISVCALVLTGCCSIDDRAGAKETKSLSGAWTVRNVAEAQVLFRSLLTLQFEDGRFSGFGGCNTYTGQYAASEGSIEFSGMTVTMKACRPDVMMQEKKFLTLLEDVKRYSVDSSGVLWLQTADGRSIGAVRAR